MQDPKSIVNDLINTYGLTQTELAAMIQAEDVPVTQATISRIASGEHKSTKFEIGAALLKIYKKRKQLKH